MSSLSYFPINIEVTKRLIFYHIIYLYKLFTTDRLLDFLLDSLKEKRVSLHSIASSLALQAGIPKEDIVTLGNRASSTTFENHHRCEYFFCLASPTHLLLLILIRLKMSFLMLQNQNQQL